MINNGIVAFCDSSKLVSQLYDIGWQNGKIGPRRSDMHDDHANAAALAVFVCTQAAKPRGDEARPTHNHPDLTRRPRRWSTSTP
jgi:hypothetical protein